MALPKIDLPLFELTLPSTNKKIKYRPFTVKEEKILLIAQESKDPKQIILAIKQILNNCVQGANVEDFATFDIEYVLLNVRAKSVNNEITFNIKDPDTQENVELTVDVNEIQIKKSDEHTKIIKITDEIYLNMKYPSITYLENTEYDADNKPKNGSLFDVIIECIDSVCEGDVVYRLKDFTEQEVQDFIESLSSDVIARIKKFFDTAPAMRYEMKYRDKTGKEKTFVLEGLNSFFI